MATLSLFTDAVLSTSRTVRRRLDPTRPVEREPIQECWILAQQAPARSMLQLAQLQLAHFIVVTDTAKAHGLAEHVHEVPVPIVPCDRAPPSAKNANVLLGATVWGSILPGVWSFMLVARARGLAGRWARRPSSLPTSPMPGVRA